MAASFSNTQNVQDFFYVSPQYRLVNSLSVLTAKLVLPPSFQELLLSYEDPKLFWLFHLVLPRFCPGSLGVVQPGNYLPESFSYRLFNCIKPTVADLS